MKTPEAGENELMIRIRKDLAKRRVPPGEAAQGIVFSLLTSIEHLKGAKQLFETKQVIPAYVALISGVEEIGKAREFFEILTDWQDFDRGKRFSKNKKNHQLKLSTAVEILDIFVSRKSIDVRVSGIFADYFGSETLTGVLVKGPNSKAAKILHDTRMAIAYTDFDGKFVSGPAVALSKINVPLCQATAAILVGGIQKLLKILDHFFPIYMPLIRECYGSSDPKRVKALKSEINRRVERTMPAIRATIEPLYIAHAGKDFSKSVELSPEEQAKWNEFASRLDIRAIIKDVAELIVSHRKMNKHHIFPPLKDWAKEYYKRWDGDASRTNFTPIPK